MSDEGIAGQTNRQTEGEETEVERLRQNRDVDRERLKIQLVFKSEPLYRADHVSRTSQAGSDSEYNQNQFGPRGPREEHISGKWGGHQWPWLDKEIDLVTNGVLYLN